MADVLKFDGMTKLELPVDQVLTAAIGQLLGCIIVGEKEDGEFWVSASYCDIHESIVMLERAKLFLIRQLEEL